MSNQEVKELCCNCLTILGVLYSVLGPMLYKGTLNIHEKTNEVV